MRCPSGEGSVGINIGGFMEELHTSAFVGNIYVANREIVARPTL
jgi:hypothetical protein